MSDRCDGCKYFKHERGDMGICRFNPPQLVDSNKQPTYAWQQAITHQSGYCGKHKPVEVESPISESEAKVMLEKTLKTTKKPRARK